MKYATKYGLSIPKLKCTESNWMYWTEGQAEISKSINFKVQPWHWPYTRCLAALSTVSLFFLKLEKKSSASHVQGPMFSLQHDPQTKTKQHWFPCSRNTYFSKLVNVLVKETFSEFFYTSNTGVFSLRDWMLIRQRSTIRNLVSLEEDTLN